jgi:hypothetical protein
VAVLGFLGIVAYLASLLSQMIMFQMQDMDGELQKSNEAPEDFMAKLPLDLTFNYQRSNITEFFESIGPVGVPVFQNYLIWDTINVPFYAFAHFALLTYLYKGQDPLAYPASKIPVVMAALDIYENLGLYMISVYGYDTLSEAYVQRIYSANTAKFSMFFIMLGLELSGLFSIVTGKMKKDVKDSGITEASTEQEKKTEDKRKARLEKKKK